MPCTKDFCGHMARNHRDGHPFECQVPGCPCMAFSNGGGGGQ